MSTTETALSPLAQRVYDLVIHDGDESHRFPARPDGTFWSRYECQLADWNEMYGLALGLTRGEDPNGPIESAAARALAAAREAYVRYAEDGTIFTQERPISRPPGGPRRNLWPPVGRCSVTADLKVLVGDNMNADDAAWLELAEAAELSLRLPGLSLVTTRDLREMSRSCRIAAGVGAEGDA